MAQLHYSYTETILKRLHCKEETTYLRKTEQEHDPVKNGKYFGLIVYVGMGYGYRAPAEAIEQALNQKGIGTRCIDLFVEIGKPWQDRNWKFNNRFMFRHPSFYNFFYHLGNKGIVRPLRIFQAILIERTILRYLRKTRPDFVLSTHFYTTNIFTHVIKKYKLDIAMYAYNSEVVSAHRIDITGGVRKFFVATREGAERMAALGQPEKTVCITNFPIDKKFTGPFSPIKQERKKLGLKDKFTILFTFGGNGIGPYALVEEMTKSRMDIQVVVICGWNEAAKRSLLSLRSKRPEFDLVVEGFVSNMQDYLYCSDISVGKSGMNAVFESIYLKKPFLTLMSQLNEKPAAIFVQNHGYGWDPSSKSERMKILKSCVDDPGFLKQVTRNLEENDISFDGKRTAECLSKDLKLFKIERLRKWKNLYIDMAGTLCDIPIGGVWHAVNTAGIKKVFERLEINKQVGIAGLNRLAENFVEKKAELRGIAKETLKEFEIKKQLLDFLEDKKLKHALEDIEFSPELLNELESLFMSTELEITVPFKETEGVINYLAARCTLYLLSNNVSRVLVEDILDMLSVKEKFRTIFVSADFGYRKPHRNYLLHITKQTGLNPARCVMIGDRLTQDIKMANKVNMLSIYAAMVDHEDNCGEESEYYFYMIKDLRELMEIF